MPSRQRLSTGAAIALGALQGPTELLPVSSSAHTTLIPWLMGWNYPGLDPELRKAFEVALHAGAAAALAIDMRSELVEAGQELSGRRLAVIALSLGPPAIAGYVLERPIERRLGAPRSIAIGLLVGAIAMALADLRPGRGPDRHERAGERRTGSGKERKSEQRARECKHRTRGARGHEDARMPDGLALGLAQTVALIPGVSRNGATLTAARSRGFARADAQTLSWHAGLPVIAGASALKAWRLSRGGLPGGAGPALAAGAGSAFVSTAASARLLRRPRVSTRALLPYALYRCALAAVALVRLRGTQNMSR